MGRRARVHHLAAEEPRVEGHLRRRLHGAVHVHVLLQVRRAKGKRPRRAAGRRRRRPSRRRERERGEGARSASRGAGREGREASSGPPGPSGVEWAAAGEATSRAACLAACAANHSCQRFRFEEEEGGREAGGDARCALRVDPGQGERDGDVIGAGIYNNKCWVPGC